MIAGRFAAVGLIVVFLAVFCCSGALAVTWFTDGFDSYNVGPLQGNGGWFGGDNTVRVQSELAQSGKAVKMDYLSWGAGESSHLIEAFGGDYFVDFYVAMDTSAGANGENLGYVKLYNSSGDEITRLYLAHQKLKVLSSGPVDIFDYTTIDIWRHIRIAVRPSTGRMDVWVDGVQKITDAVTYAFATNKSSAIGKIGVAQWPNLGQKFTKSEAYVDNIVVETPGGAATKLDSLRTGWEHGSIFFPFVMADPEAGGYRMWYTSSGYAQNSDANWEQEHIRIALSADGETWARRKHVYDAVLSPLRLHQGDVLDKATVVGIFDSIYAFGGCLIKDGPVYKMWYTGWNGNYEHLGGGITRKFGFKIGYATSPDGEVWTRQSGDSGGGSVLGLGGAGTPDAEGSGQPSVVKEGANYRMWYEGFDGSVWRILYATSGDGVNWTKQGAALNPGSSGTLDAQGARNPVVVTRNGQYEMWYTGVSAASPKYHVMRATSPDGLNWAKVSGEVALHPDDALDGNETQYVDSVIVNPDNTCRVFFSKDNITPSAMKWGTVTSRSIVIYTEVVNP